MADMTLLGATAVSTSKPEVTSPEIEAAKAAPDYSDKMKRFEELASTVLDTTGKFTDDERLQAFVSVTAMATSAQLRGMGADRAKIYDQVAFGSDIGQRVDQLQRAQSAAVMQAPEGSGAKAALTFYDGLSTSDQSFLFQGSINAPMRDGKKFASVQGWRDNMNAMIKLSDYTQQNRDLIASGATTKADDPKFEAALKLGNAADVGSASWSSMVLKLFEGPRDKIDLSDGAKRLVGDVKDASRASEYQQGSIASKTV